MTAKKTAAKKAKISTAGNAKKKVERLEKALKEAAKKKPLGRMILQGRVCGSRVGSVSQRRMMPTTGIPLHIEQVIAQCVDTKTAESNLIKSEETKKALIETIYVGIKQNGNFVRRFEEHDTGEDLSYEVIFTTATVPTRRSHPEYNLLVGPFATVRAAEVFRDREGVNSVEEAERLVH